MAETKIKPQEMTNPYKFSAYKIDNTSITGTQVDTIICANENFDTNGDYNAGVGVYIAPIAGYYLITGHARIDSTGATYLQLYVAGHKCNGVTTANGRQENLIGVVLVYLAAGGQASMGVYHSGNCNIIGSSTETAIAGYLVSF